MGFWGNQLDTGQVRSGWMIQEPFSTGLDAVSDYTKYTNPYNTFLRVNEREKLDYTPDSLEEFEFRRSFRMRYGGGIDAVPMDDFKQKRDDFITHADAQKMAEERGLDPSRLPKDEEHSVEYWDDLLDAIDVKTKLETTISRVQPSASFMAASLGTGMVAFAQDPINVATFFIPVVGTGGKVAQFVAKGKSLIGRVGRRALTGFGEGVVASTAVEPIYYGLTRQEDLDYDMSTALTNIAIGGLFGSAVNVIAGPTMERAFFGKEFARIFDSLGVDLTKAITKRAEDGKPLTSYNQIQSSELQGVMSQIIANSDRETVEVVMRAAINQLMKGEKVDIMGILSKSSGVQSFVRTIRDTDTVSTLSKIIGEVAEDINRTLDVDGAISKSERVSIVNKMEGVKKELAELAEIREGLKAQSKLEGGGVKQQMEVVKKDKVFADAEKKLQKSLDGLLGTLDNSRASKQAKSDIKDMIKRIHSGEMLEDAITETDNLLKLLHHLSPNESSIRGASNINRNYKGVDKVVKETDDLIEKQQTQVNKADDAFLDDEITELDIMVKDEVDEAGMNTMGKDMTKIDEAQSKVIKIIDDFKKCRMS